MAQTLLRALLFMCYNVARSKDVRAVAVASSGKDVADNKGFCCAAVIITCNTFHAIIARGNTRLN